ADAGILRRHVAAATGLGRGGRGRAVGVLGVAARCAAVVARLVVVARGHLAGALVLLAQVGLLLEARGVGVERIDLLRQLGLARAQRPGLRVELVGIRERIDVVVGDHDLARRRDQRDR